MKKHPGPQGPRRPQVAVRLSTEGVAHLDYLARARGLVKPNGDPNRSEMIRVLLAYAVRKMPSGWTP